MESEDYEDSEDFELEEKSSSKDDNDDDKDKRDNKEDNVCEENKRKQEKCLRLQEKKKCSWINGKCGPYKKREELDFEAEEKSSEDDDKNDKDKNEKKKDDDKDDDRKKKVDCSKKENKNLKSCRSSNRIDKDYITCVVKYSKNESKCSEQAKNKVCYWNADKKRCTLWKKRELDFDSEDVEDEEVATALA